MNKKQLLDELVANKVLKTKTVIEAFRKVPREDFVPSDYKKHAYVDEPLPIGSGQTISQPQTVAAMTESLDVKEGNIVLEVGAGSGYQAAILSEITGPNGRVITTEIIPHVYDFAKKNLSGYKNVSVVNIDGSLGYDGKYDRILVAASAPRIPQPLIDCLKDGGRMIIPVGDRMMLIKKDNGKTTEKFLGYYSFVPLTGKHGHRS
ncbi:MAG TPA: protein-L-isoaspartate O-methyltransferase [archaeon]|nr:protein-L-isoaspartate O-methyltransferase [archaeon]